MRLVVTGTPGTGKTTVAKEIARAGGARVIDANALVKRRALWFDRAKREADLRALKREILKEVKASPDGFVAEGHLLCEFALPLGEVDACVVLRCDPRVLAKRLQSRGYPKKKVAENVLCEILDYCSLRAERAYGTKKIVEVDATKRVSAEEILENLEKAAQKAKRERCGSLNWSSLLLDERFKKRLGLS